MIPDIEPRPGNRSDPAPDFPWPNGARCAVFPSFDVDAESAWLAYDVKRGRMAGRSFQPVHRVFPPGHGRARSS